MRGIHRSPVNSAHKGFNVFFDLRLNKRLSKQSWGWWFETLSRPLWRHCNGSTWWRHEMETLFTLLAICAGNSPVTGEFPAQKPVTRSCDVFFDLRLNTRWVNNGEAGALRRHLAHYDVIVMIHREGSTNQLFVHPLAIVLGLFCACQFFKFIFWDCYKNLAFCNMNYIEQFIIF